MAKPDLVVVGAGIAGLWTAWAALGRGWRVRVLDGAGPGAGASGGPVGALAPHVPERWNAKKAFQLAALLDLPQALAAVEAAGGGRAGWARVGRAQPLRTIEARARAEARIAAAAAHWGGAARMELAPPVRHARWLDPLCAPWGLLLDDLTARLDPAAACDALARAIRARGGEVLAGTAVRAVAGGAVETASGRMAAGAVVVAAGVASFPLLAPHLGGVAGGPVKGQALLLAGTAEGLPLLYADGVYVVPQVRGVAVGSTSEPGASDLATDAGLDALRLAAERLCPALEGRAVLARWAGLRPRAAGREPMAGPVPGVPGLHVLTGGYKTGFGLAHALARAVVAGVAGEDPGLPAGFRPGDHRAALAAGAGRLQGSRDTAGGQEHGDA